MANPRYYSVAQLSENISETPEGFLICRDVPITRAGEFQYLREETPIKNNDDITLITRTAESIHSAATIASYEGKPVTINHPDEFISPDNWRALAVGVVQNVRAGVGTDNDKLLADLLITDREAIQAVKERKLREVSCGYEAEYIDAGAGKGEQANIIGNHVALVTAGRCGSECAIFDHAPKFKENPKMSIKEKILSVFSKALDDAAIEESIAPEATPEPTPEPTAAPDAAPAADENPNAAIMARLDKLEAAIAAMTAAEMSDTEEEVVIEDMCKDAEVLSRAEILAPGIAPTADIKAKAIDTAYATADGKAIIDTLLAGKELATADKDTLFIAAAELMKNARKAQLNNAARASLDSLPAMKAGDMTPEKINELNAKIYGKK